GLGSLDLLAAELAARPDVAMVVIDPIAALLGGVDAHRDAEIRSALQPLADLAALRRVAVVVVMHLRKSEANRAIYRVGGSIGFVGLARSVLLVARDEESGRRAIVPLKNNLTAEVGPVEFTIDGQGFWWGGVADDLGAERLLGAARPAEERSAMREAQDAIAEILSGGAVLATDLERQTRDLGIASRTMQRARAAMRDAGRIARTGGGVAGPVVWRSKQSTDRHDPHSSPTHMLGDLCGSLAKNGPLAIASDISERPIDDEPEMPPELWPEPPAQVVETRQVAAPAVVAEEVM
ncbi:MAG: AAA family ATPase, partial [Candidatus Dormibacteria bacterium]